jgi:HD-GYP domain-containing protein (c-di-GMP phosphodiesterase class II)
MPIGPLCRRFRSSASIRPYRPASSLEDALAELLRCAGAQFGPAVVEALAAELELEAGVARAADVLAP